MFNLHGRKVLITGATGGIGKSLSAKFYAKGCKVFLHGTNEERLRAFAEELKTLYPDCNAENIYLTQADLSKQEMVKYLASNVIEQMQGIDVLINNAGITKDGLLMRMSNKDFEDVLNINLLSACLLARDISVSMLKQRFGRIINISSVVGILGNAGQTNYCAAKAGLIGFSKALARELAAKNVTVNCIAPGFIESAMTDKLNEKQIEVITSSIPMKRIGKSDDVSAAALYLASDEASYITGQTLHINGGMAMI